MILVITSRLQPQIISVHLCAQKNHFLDSLCDFFQWVWKNFCIFKLMDYAIILLYTFTMFFFKFCINFVTLHPQFFHIWLCSKYPGLFMTWSKLICMFHGSFSLKSLSASSRIEFSGVNRSAIQWLEGKVGLNKIRTKSAVFIQIGKDTGATDRSYTVQSKPEGLYSCQH